MSSGTFPPVYFRYILIRLAIKKSFSFGVGADQKYGFPKVIVKPVLDAHCFSVCCCGVAGTNEEYDMIAFSSSRFHVLPIEKVPLGFSRALWTLTLPDLRTATRITLFFLLAAGDSGGGGDEG